MLLPDDSQRHTIIGKTGSGKTHLALWFLSMRSLGEMDWYILDFKRDELLNQLPAIELDGLKLPRKVEKRLYIARPDTEYWEQTDAFMNSLHQRTHNGLFVDEAMELYQPKHPAYRRLLTQGRSLVVPVTSLSQRPVELPRLAFNQSEFLSFMKLSDDREWESIRDMTGYRFTVEPKRENDIDVRTLPKYYSYYVDKSGYENNLTITPPAPEFDEIVETFKKKLTRRSASIMI